MDYKTDQMVTLIKTENIDWSKKETYKGKSSFFTDDVIFQCIDKINFTYLFYYVKIKSAETRKKLFTYVLENKLNTKDRNLNIGQATVANMNFNEIAVSFFEKQKLEEEELKEYMYNMFFKYKIKNAHSISFPYMIQKKQKLTVGIMKFMQENKMYLEIDFLTGKMFKTYLFAPTEEFTKYQDMPENFYLTDPVFSQYLNVDFTNLFFDYINNMLTNGRFSNDKIFYLCDKLSFLPNISQMFLQNKNIDFDEKLLKCLFKNFSRDYFKNEKLQNYLDKNF